MSPVKAPLASGWQSCPPRLRSASLDPEGGLRDQRRRRTDEQFGTAGFPRVRRLPYRVDLGQRPGQAVHLPISGDQRPYARGHSGLSATLIGGCYHRPPPLQSHPFAYAKHSSAAREGALARPEKERRIRRNARIDTQCLPGCRRQGDHDHRHGAHHRQLRHLGRGRHAARFQPVHGRVGRGRENLGPGLSRRLRSGDPAISAPAQAAVHQRGSPPGRPRPQRPAAIAERSGGR